MKSRLHLTWRNTTGDHGSIALEMAILFPVVLALSLIVLQGALVYHARSLALAAAQEGAHAAANQNGTSADGLRETGAFLDDTSGTSFLKNPTSQVDRSPTQVSVTVSGRTLMVIPGVRFTVSQTAVVPVERLTK